MKRDKEAKTLQIGVKQESRSCTGSGILWVASEVINGTYMILSFLSFVFLSETVLRYSAPSATKQSGLLVNL